ncbi:hypothetical protein F4777DRAFT_203668 [Nemania sp. FL0916]|nr:hypothetical protein F4777DRAFT_203668 [Nemania sp. FL0916]
MNDRFIMINTTAKAIGVGIAFPIVDGVLVWLRFYTRRQQKAGYRLDDWLCIPAWFFLVGCSASLLTGVFGGAFDEVPPLPVEIERQQCLFVQVSTALLIFWILTNFLIKLIILLFYRRIFIGRIFNMCNWILIVLSVVWFVSAVAFWLFTCATYFKDVSGETWYYFERRGRSVLLGVFLFDNIIDFGLVILPLPFTWRLQLNLKHKIAVTVVFIIGSLAFVASFGNTIIQLFLIIEPELFFDFESDLYQVQSPVGTYWPIIEVGAGLLTSNLPHLSSRVADALNTKLSHALRASLDSVRYAVKAIPMVSFYKSKSQHDQSRDVSGERRQTRHSGMQQQEAVWGPGNVGIAEKTKWSEQSSERSLDV